MSPAPKAHDLYRQVCWIPVVRDNGDVITLPLRDVLENAHDFRELAGDDLVWASLMRFLPSVMALIVREAGAAADLDSWVELGIPPQLIHEALDPVAGHLWLRHPDTPFMQEPRLLRQEGKENTVEWLHLQGASTNGKTWWGKSGDPARPGAGSVARAAQGLVASWYFSPGVSGQSTGSYEDDPDTSWRPRGTLRFTSHGLRVFHRGRNLAETLLANTMEQHVKKGRGRNLPLWARTGEDVTPSTPLLSSTWTGSVYLLDFDDTGHPTGVHVGGRRIPGVTGTSEERKKQLTTIESGLWRADPTIPRVPLRKAGEDTSEARAISPLHPSASAVQWAAEWYTADQKRGSARPMEPGVIEVSGSDAFQVALTGPKTGPEVAYFSRVGEVSDVASPRARSRLLSLSSMVVTPIRSTLFTGLNKALGPEMARPLHDRLFAAFCNLTEPILDDLIHAPAFERQHAEAFVAAAGEAFEAFLTPYLNSRTLAGHAGGDGIASAIAHVRGRLTKTLREVTL